MKTLLIISTVIGLAVSEKLDRTYLPPPGSKFSGGNLEENDVPLEFPKETYPSPSFDNKFGSTETAVGINRVGSNISPEINGDVTSTVPPIQENTDSFPTTTTSYAFLQTTSFLPATSSTVQPKISIDPGNPSDNSVNKSIPSFIREMGRILNYAGPDHIHNVAEDEQVVNEEIDIFENNFSHNKMHSLINEKINGENEYSINDEVNSPVDNSPSNHEGIQGISLFPTETDHLSLNNNSDTYESLLPSEPINQKYVNLISSTPMLSYDEYSRTSTISPTNTPYSYFTGRKQSQDRQAVNLNYDNTITPDGYAYSFDTSNRIHADETGTAVNGVRAVGSYSYIGDDGQLYSINYTADENGFRPYGAHLPTAPPIPDAILKVIEQAAIDKANGIYHDGSYDESKYGYQRYNPGKNIKVLKQNNQEDTNSNRGISNTQLPYFINLDKNLHKYNNTNKENEQNITTKTQLHPFMEKGESLDETISELSPKYKSKHFENKEKHYKEDTDNDYDNKIQNNILNSVTYFKEEETDRIMNAEPNKGTGYHYIKPKIIPKTPISNRISEMYQKIDEKLESRDPKPFMTPYVTRNDNTILENVGDNKYHEQGNVMSSKPKNSPAFIEPQVILGKTANPEIHNFINQFKPSENEVYVYSQKIDSNNDSQVPSITSTDSDMSDVKPTIPTAFPSRFSTTESNKANKLNDPSEQLDSRVFENQDRFPNHEINYENYQGSLRPSNKLDSYGNDYTDAGLSYNTPNGYEADKDYNIEHTTTKTSNGEDFSGPKQSEKFDSLTGYHY